MLICLLGTLGLHCCCSCLARHPPRCGRHCHGGLTPNAFPASNITACAAHFLRTPPSACPCRGERLPPQAGPAQCSTTLQFGGFKWFTCDCRFQPGRDACLGRAAVGAQPLVTQWTRRHTNDITAVTVERLASPTANGRRKSYWCKPNSSLNSCLGSAGFKWDDLPTSSCNGLKPHFKRRIIASPADGESQPPRLVLPRAAAVSSMELILPTSPHVCHPGPQSAARPTSSAIHLAVATPSTSL